MKQINKKSYIGKIYFSITLSLLILLTIIAIVKGYSYKDYLSLGMNPNAYYIDNDTCFNGVWECDENWCTWWENSYFLNASGWQGLTGDCTNVYQTNYLIIALNQSFKNVDDIVFRFIDNANTDVLEFYKTPYEITLEGSSDNVTYTEFFKWTNPIEETTCEDDGGGARVGILDVLNTTIETNTIKYIKVIVNGKNCAESGIYSALIDELNISFETISNDIPIIDRFNISNTTECIEEGNFPEFILNISASDSEGDTLYYSLGSTSIDFQDILFYEDFVDTYADVCKKDFDVLGSNTFHTNATVPTSEIGSNLFWLRTTDNWQNIIFSPLNYCNGMLVTAEGVSYFDFVYPSSLNGNSSSSFLLYFPNNNTEINVVPRMDNGQNIFNLSFFQDTTGNLSIIFDDIEVYNHRKDNYVHDDDNAEDIIIDFEINQMTGLVNITLLFQDTETNIDLHLGKNISVNNYNVLRFYTLTKNKASVDEDFWYMSDLFVEGKNINEVIDFSTTKPTSFIPIQIGKTVLTLYVTDDVHLPYEYNSEVIYINVLPNCNYITTPENVFSDETMTNFGIIKNTHWAIVQILYSVYDTDWILWTDMLYLIGCYFASMVVYKLSMDSREYSEMTFFTLGVLGNLFLIYKDWIVWFTALGFIFVVIKFIYTRLTSTNNMGVVNE